MNCIHPRHASPESNTFLNGSSLETSDQDIPLKSSEMPPSDRYLLFSSGQETHPPSIPSSPTRHLYQHFQHNGSPTTEKVHAAFNASFQHPNQNILELPADPLPRTQEGVSPLHPHPDFSASFPAASSSSRSLSSTPPCNERESSMARPEDEAEWFADQTVIHPRYDEVDMNNEEASFMRDPLVDSNSFSMRPQFSSAFFPESEAPVHFPSLELDPPSASDRATTGTLSFRVSSAPAETENGNVPATLQIDSHPPEDSGLDNRRVVLAHDSGISSHRNEFALQGEIITGIVPTTTLSSASTQDQSSSSSADAISATQRNTTANRTNKILVAERRLKSREKREDDAKAYREMERNGWSGLTKERAAQARAHELRMKQRAKRLQRKAASRIDAQKSSSSTMSKWGEKEAVINAYKILASPCSQNENRKRNQLSNQMIQQYGWNTPAERSAIEKAASSLGCEPPKDQDEIITRAKQFLLQQERDQNTTRYKARFKRQNAPLLLRLPPITGASSSGFSSAPAETENGNVTATLEIAPQTPGHSSLGKTSVLRSDESGRSRPRNEFSLEGEIITGMIPATTLSSDSTQPQFSSSSSGLTAPLPTPSFSSEELTHRMESVMTRSQAPEDSADTSTIAPIPDHDQEEIEKEERFSLEDPILDAGSMRTPFESPSISFEGTRTPLSSGANGDSSSSYLSPDLSKTR